MDKRLLNYYERELRFVRELGAEFARRFPKVAGRLGITEMACEDPHVERLFQGFSLLSARAHQRLDAEFPEFSSALMQQVYPHYLGPTPSMAVVQFTPNPKAGSLNGFVIPRDTALRVRPSLRGVAACEYRTAHAVELWPLVIESIEYSSVLRDIADLRIPTREPIKALVRLRLHVTGGRRFEQLNLRALPFYVRGADQRMARLYEALVAHSNSLVMRWGPHTTQHIARTTAAQPVRALGFEDDQALLPTGPHAFHGYRLLQEYFAFPTRFHFLELCGLEEGVKRCASDRMDILIALSRYDASLEGVIDTDRMLPFATPVINLFPRSCDPVPLTSTQQDLLVVPDRTRPRDFELHSVTRVAAAVPGGSQEQEFFPLQAVRGRLEREGGKPHYALSRRPRVVPFEERRLGERAAYIGSDVFLRLVDDNPTQSTRDMRHVVVQGLCTNRDLPLLLSQAGADEFTTQSGAPVESIRCVAGPSAPRETPMDGELAWSLISQLTVNYLQICEEPGGTEALREMLGLYARLGDPILRREVEGVRKVSTTQIIRPIPAPGPRSFTRGLEVQLECEEWAFSAQGVFTLASVLSAFFAKHASVHSFTETVLSTLERGEVFRWPTMPGLRGVL